MRIILFAVLLVLSSAVATAFAQNAVTTNCDARDSRVQEISNSVGPGPFQLEAVHCQVPGLEVRQRVESVALSPDISSFGMNFDYLSELAVGRVSSPGEAARHPYGLGGLFGNALACCNSFQRRPMRWSGDSRSLWIAPPGEVENTVRTIRIEDGIAHELPEMRHAAGALHKILWAEDGRALALFGERLSPTIAFVDAVRGQVIETLSLQEIGAPSRYGISAAEVVGLQDGRLRAFAQIGGIGLDLRWVVWTQGAPPRFFPAAFYPASPQNWTNEIATAISADGKHILIVRNLSMGMFCSEGPDYRGCRPSGPPLEGVLAAFHELETGRAIWTYRSRVSTLWRVPIPELSDDGRYALIGLPPSDASGRYSIGLLSTSDGSVQQVFPLARRATMGFARGSQRLWINEGAGETAVYVLR